MTTTTSTDFARETDTALAGLYRQLQTVEDRFDRLTNTATQQAGAKFYYRGRRRVTDMTLADAETILAADIEKHADDEYGYTQVRGGTSIGGIRRTVEGLAECRTARRELHAQIRELNERYTGWSRFFLVTSSAGHIHSSMHCSTCRPTTTYGWLPELSGKTEAEAVAAHGPALCSVCFASAPVEYVGGKITKAAAEKAAA